MLALVAALALFVQPDTTARFPEAPSDTVDTAEEAVEEVAEDIARARVRPVFSPSALYSGSRGFGLGGGIAADDVLARGDHLQIEARLAQRLQGAHLEYLTGEPGVERWAGLLGAAGWTTTRTNFVGYGPHSARAGQLFLDRLAAEAEARLVWSPAGPGGPVVQPTGRLRYNRIRGFEERRAGALAAVLPADLARLDRTTGEDRYGAEVALSVVRDGRDRPSITSRGVYAEGEVARFQSFDGTGLGFWRTRASLIAFRPALIRLPFLPERGAVFMRVTGVVTREDGAADLPWFYLPELDRELTVGFPRGEFVGRDALAVGAGVRGVIGQAIGAFLIEGVATTRLGAAYDDVFTEFTPRVRFTRERVAVGERVPLTPSLAVGLNLHYLDRERPLVGGLIGISPEGVSLASLRLVWGLEGYRPRLR